MTIKDLLNYQEQVSINDKKILISFLLNKSNLVFNLEEKVSKDIFFQYKRFISKLLAGKPLQYIIGQTNFYGYNFIVNEKVLIPRFETEELVEKTIVYIKNQFNGKGKLIDLGCGSGAIGLTIKKECPKVDVTLLDISEQSLEVAKLNREQLKVDAKIIKGDMLNDITNKYDIIISNPPYIKENEPIAELVKNNEPSLALYGGYNGLKYYEQILKKVKAVTNDKFLISFEIGSNQADEIVKLINKYLDNVIIDIKKDLQNRNRMIFVTHNCE